MEHLQFHKVVAMYNMLWLMVVEVLVHKLAVVEELGQEPSGPYAGCIGYISFGGEHMDTAIAIRTAVIRDGWVQVQAGAGIVADSVAANEHRECVNKATAMFRAVALARNNR